MSVPGSIIGSMEVPSTITVLTVWDHPLQIIGFSKFGVQFKSFDTTKNVKIPIIAMTSEIMSIFVFICFGWWLLDV